MPSAKFKLSLTATVAISVVTNLYLCFNSSYFHVKHSVVYESGRIVDNNTISSINNFNQAIKKNLSDPLIIYAKKKLSNQIKDYSLNLKQKAEIESQKNLSNPLIIYAKKKLSNQIKDYSLNLKQKAEIESQKNLSHPLIIYAKKKLSNQIKDYSLNLKQKAEIESQKNLSDTLIIYAKKKLSNQTKDYSLNLKQKAEIESQKSVIEFLSGPVVNHYNISYLHVPRVTCVKGLTKIIFVVPSAPDNFMRRKHVRKSTQAKYVQASNSTAILLFFIGRPARGQNTPDIQAKINQEIHEYNDIVQEDFEDVYRNILIKAVSMLKWVSTYCSHADFVLRTDDDVGVDAGKLIQVLQKKRETFPNFILGQVKVNDVPARDKKIKWYLSKKEYPFPKLPRFALGGLLGYPVSTVHLLYQASLRVKRIWLDDVYITGMCAPRVNVPLFEDKDFVFQHKNKG